MLLFTDVEILMYDVEHMRGDYIWFCIQLLTKRRRMARWLAKSLYSSLAVPVSHEEKDTKCICDRLKGPFPNWDVLKRFKCLRLYKEKN